MRLINYYCDSMGKQKTPKRITAEDIAEEALNDVQEEQKEETSSKSDNKITEVKEEKKQNSKKEVKEEQEPAPQTSKKSTKEHALEGRDEFGVVYGKVKDEAQAVIKGRLEKQELVSVYVPLAIGEKAGKHFHNVTIGGFRVYVPKGVMVKVPEHVFNIISESYNLTLNAGQAFRADRDEEKDGLSVSDRLN